MSWANQFLIEWFVARGLGQVLMPQHIDPHILQQRPPSGFMKCNITQYFTVLIITHVGVSTSQMIPTVLCLVNPFGCPIVLPVSEGEAFGLSQSLLQVEDLDMSHIIFESDCKTIVDKIYVQKSGSSEEEDTIIGDFCCILSPNPNSSVKFLRKQANVIANILRQMQTMIVLLYIIFHLIVFLISFSMK